MVSKITSDRIEVLISEEVEEVLKREISTFGNGAHTICPKEHVGKIAYIVVCKE